MLSIKEKLKQYENEIKSQKEIKQQADEEVKQEFLEDEENTNNFITYDDI